MHTDGDTVSVGLNPQRILDAKDQPTTSIQTVDLTVPTDLTSTDDKEYCFYNLPKYDATGAVMHYTVEEVWLDKNGATPQEVTDLDAYLKENLENYPANYSELEGLLKEYSFSITDQSYTVGEASDSTDSTDGRSGGQGCSRVCARENRRSG